LANRKYNSKSNQIETENKLKLNYREKIEAAEGRKKEGSAVRQGGHILAGSKRNSRTVLEAVESGSGSGKQGI